MNNIIGLKVSMQQRTIVGEAHPLTGLSLWGGTVACPWLF